MPPFIQEAVLMVGGGQPRGTTCNRLPNLIFTVAMPTLKKPPYPLYVPFFSLSFSPLCVLDFRVIRLSLPRSRCVITRTRARPIGMYYSFFPFSAVVVVDKNLRDQLMG